MAARNEYVSVDRRKLDPALELAILLEAAVDGIVCIDHEGRIDTFNPAAERMFGYKAKELLGSNIRELMPEPYRSEHDEYLRRYLRTGRERIIGVGREITARRKDGTVFPVHLSVGQIGNRPRPRFIGIIRDITDRKRFEDELKLERDRSKMYLDVAGVILLALDSSGRITMINRTGCEILGYPEEELLGQDWLPNFIPGHTRSEVASIFDNLVGGELRSFSYHENVVRTRSGAERLIAWRNSLVRDSEGNVVGTLSSGEDITEQRHAEEEVRLFRDRLTHVSRLSTMGEMAAGLAHEINQPLTAIATYAQACQRLIKAGKIEAEELLGAMGQVSAQAERAGEIIRKLRRMVKRRETRRQRVNCNGLIRDVVTLAEADARASGISIELQLCDDLAPVTVDPVQIQQVLLNLIRNGIDASQELGTSNPVLAIRTENLSVERVKVSVTDHGVGVSAEAANLLFQPFMTTKPQGLGMGLSISRSIIKMHDGELGFVNNAEGGATFFFTLPTALGEE